MRRVELRKLAAKERREHKIKWSLKIFFGAKFNLILIFHFEFYAFPVAKFSVLDSNGIV